MTLPWITIASNTTQPANRPRQGPSWSWVAAVDDAVIYWPEPSAADVRYQVLGHSVLRSNHNEFSGLVSGRLTIQGLLLPISLEVKNTDDPHTTGLHIQELWKVESLLRHRSIAVPIDWFNRDYMPGDDLTGGYGNSRTTWLLPVSYDVVNSDDTAYAWPVCEDDTPWLEIFGIVLTSIAAHDEGNAGSLPAYERIGTLHYGWEATSRHFVRPTGVKTEREIEYINAWGACKVPATTFELF